ncbi:unnamed protein product, partial [Symbiodinium pilosum]
MSRQGHLHFEGTEDEVEEVLMESPKRPSGKSRWYLAGAGVLAVLAVVGMVKAVSHSALTFGSKHTISMQEVQHWEDIPGIDKVIQKAQSLRHD